MGPASILQRSGGGSGDDPHGDADEDEIQGHLQHRYTASQRTLWLAV